MTCRPLMIVAGLLGLLFLACSASKPKTTLDTKALSPQELMRKAELNGASLKTLRAIGKITIESQEAAGSASCEVRLKRPDSLLIKLSGPFGIGVATALVTRSQFIFYNSYDNKVITGETSQRNLRLIFRYDAGFDDVLNILTGTVRFRQEEASPPEVSIDDDQYLLLFKKGGETARYWIDPERFTVLKYQFLNNAGKLVTEETYSRFKEYNGVYFPHLIRVLKPIERQALSIYYDTAELDRQGLDFGLTVPESAEKIHWETSNDMK